MTAASGRPQLRKVKSNTRKWRINLLISTLTVVILIAGVGVYVTNNYLWRLPAVRESSQPRALVIDQLSLNYPDPSFNTNITNVLKNAGYTIDFSEPSTDAVDSFRRLPGQGYDLIIIRAHSGSSQSIITSEPYSQSEFVADQLTGRLLPAQVDGGPLYFALTPKFVSDDMMGRFSGSTIIVMGCSALEGSQNIASAFLDKGANLFVGWDSAVSIIHTDTSTVVFVGLLSSGASASEATREASSIDPVYGARLQYLDWNSLAQSRASALVSKLVVWAALASIMTIGPMAVFVAPRLLAQFDRIREGMTIQQKRKIAGNDDTNPSNS